MGRKVKPREKGKIKFSEYFKKLNDGDTVAISNERSLAFNHPGRINGKSGKVVGSNGSFKIVEIKDGNAMKKHLIHPIHLKKLK